jgi:hypothetical protein
MVLTVERHLQIATLYETAAADKMGVPPQQRAAFARKAKWFRTLARIRAKREAVAAASKEERPQEARGEAASDGQALPSGGWTPKAKYQTLAERLKRARAAAGA